MKKFTLILLFTNLLLFSQENGEWDRNNIKTEILNLNAGETKSLTLNLPLGTSKVYYTIKVSTYPFYGIDCFFVYIWFSIPLCYILNGIFF